MAFLFVSSGKGRGIQEASHGGVRTGLDTKGLTFARYIGSILFSINEPSLIKTQSRLTLQNHSDHVSEADPTPIPACSATGAASASTFQFSDFVFFGCKFGGILSLNTRLTRSTHIVPTLDQHVRTAANSAGTNYKLLRSPDRTR